MERVSKKVKDRVLDVEKKAVSPEYETSWENGVPKSKKKSEIKKGKSARGKGARFELLVRKDLEMKGRTVEKWSNNVDLTEGRMVGAKRKYNPFKKVMVIGTGFPDFIAISHIDRGLYRVIGVEVKVNGVLSKEEKEKCRWYLKNEIFSEIWIAKEKRDGRKINIEYIDFREKYMDKK